MALKDARADTYFYRPNASTFQIENLSQDNPDHQFAISDLLQVLNRIFQTSIDGTTNKPFPEYTTTELLLYATQAGWGNVISPDDVLASWVVTPFVMFQANSDLETWLTVTNTSVEPAGLPKELYTTADLTQTVPRGVIAPWTVFIFLALACFIYFSCLACLGWSMTIQGPPTTHFQLIEFAARIVSKGQSSTSWASVLSKTSNGKKAYVRSELVDKEVYLGDVSTVSGVTSATAAESDDNFPFLEASTGTIGFSLTDDVAPLSSGKVYY